MALDSEPKRFGGRGSQKGLGGSGFLACQYSHSQAIHYGIIRHKKLKRVTCNLFKLELSSLEVAGKGMLFG